MRGILIGSKTQLAIFKSWHGGANVFGTFLPRYEAMNRLITATRLKPIISGVYSFDEAKDAYRHLQSQKHVGKIVIRIANE